MSKHSEPDAWEETLYTPRFFRYISRLVSDLDHLTGLDGKAPGKIVYCVDFSEISAYCHPSDHRNITNFSLPFEEARSTDSHRINISALQDTILYRLFFCSPGLIILPPHWAEIGSESGYLLEHDVPTQESSRLAYTEVQNAMTANQSTLDWIYQTYHSQQQLSPNQQETIIKYFENIAPSLCSVLLKLSPVTKRFKTLMRDGALYDFSAFEWERVGVPAPTADKIRSFNPGFSEVERWREFLDTHRPKKGKGRANRIDAMAIEYLYQIGNILKSGTQDLVRFHLISRSTKLFDVLQDEKKLASHSPPLPSVPVLRHPRLLPMPSESREHQSALSALRRAVTDFADELGKFQAVTKAIQAPDEPTQTSTAPSDVAAKSNTLLGSIWYDLERQLFAHSESERLNTVGKDTTASSVGNDVKRFLDMFFSIKNPDDIIRFHLEERISDFSKDAFEISNVGMKATDLRVFTVESVGQCIRLSPADLGVPLALGAVSLPDGLRRGSVEEIVGLLTSQFECKQTTVAKGSEVLSSGLSRYWRYLVWAFVQGTMGRWRLSQLYADWAMRHADGSDTTEALLLYAATLRRDPKSEELAFDTTERKLRELTTSGSLRCQADPRLYFEISALTLEQWLRKSESSAKCQGMGVLREGLSFAESACSRCSDLEESEYLAVRAHSLRLCYVLYLRRFSMDTWENWQAAAICTAPDEHRRLRDLLKCLQSHGWRYHEVPSLIQCLDGLGSYVFWDEVNPRPVPVAVTVKMLELVSIAGHTYGRIGDLVVSAVDEIRERLRCSLERKTLNTLDNVVDESVTRVLIEKAPDRVRKLLSAAFDIVNKVSDEEHQGPLYWRARVSSLEKAQKMFAVAEERIESGALDDVFRHDLIYMIAMERGYCLLRLHWERGSGRDLDVAIEIYGRLEKLYPQRSMVFYRHWMALEARNPAADVREKLRTAISILENDSTVPLGHWIRMRMMRRLGARVWKEADEFRNKLCENGTLMDGDLRNAARQKFNDAFTISIAAYQRAIDLSNAAAQEEKAWCAMNLIETMMDYVDLGGALSDLVTDIQMDMLIKELLSVCVAFVSSKSRWDLDLLHQIRRLYAYMRDLENERAIADRILDVWGNEGYSDRDGERMKMYYDGALNSKGIIVGSVITETAVVRAVGSN